jgi:hypothetical protein
MNKITLLLAGVALVASSLSAAAAEIIPAKYRGEWCDHISGNFYTRYSPKVCKRGGLGYMRITAAGYEHEMEDVERCRVVKVRTYSPPPTNHLITFTCDIDGAERPQTLMLWFSTTTRGKLLLYIEPLDSDQKDQ